MTKIVVIFVQILSFHTFCGLYLMNLYLFNPETDLALATNKASYTASTKIRQMAHDLAMLPLWYAEPGSAVWVPDETGADFAEKMASEWGLKISLVREKNFSNQEIEKVVPWGWNLALRNQLLRMGIDARVLPSEEELDYRRNLSSRATVISFLEQFKHLPDCSGEAANLYTLEECLHYTDAHREGVVFKSPWSSSGKGLLWCREQFVDRHQRWCQRLLKEQGLVTAQPIKQRCQDFAMEFLCSEGHRCRFVGYSLFTTNEQGAYLGNRLLSDEEIEKLLGTYIPRNVLLQVREILRSYLESFDYQGYVGIDMMTCRESEQHYSLHPCVEVNWRMNMGVLSHHLREHFLCEGVSATFHVENYASHEALLRDFGTRMEAHPYRLQQGRLASGILPLTPIAADTYSVAYVSTD